MKIANGLIVLENEPCICAIGNNDTPGKVAGKKVCPKCKGTRRGPRGGRNKCGCYDGTVPDFTNLVTCGRCNGTATVPETDCSTITQEQWAAFEFKVIRDPDGQFGFNEAYLGLGYVSTYGDHGAAWGAGVANDHNIVAKVKADGGYIQATKISKEGKVADYIAIIITPNGYKVKAMYNAENPSDNTKADQQVRAMFDPRGLAIAEMYVARDQG